MKNKILKFIFQKKYQNILNLSIENYQSTVFFFSDSLATILDFLFPEIYTTLFAEFIDLGCNYPSKARYYHECGFSI